MVPRYSALFLAISVANAPLCTDAKSRQVFPPGTMVLAGSPVQCGNAQTVVAPIDDIAMAYPGTILLDPDLFAMPDAIQHFWYAHECAHQLFGYDEVAADCWAIQTGKQWGWFASYDFEWMDRNFIYLRGSAKHPPGPKRLANLKGCYAKATKAGPPPPQPMQVASTATCAAAGHWRDVEP